MTPQGVVTFIHNFNDGTTLNDGLHPQGGVALTFAAGQGKILGTTNAGGSGAEGTLYQLNTAASLVGRSTVQGAVGTPLSYQLTTSKNFSGITFTSSTLPAGLTLNKATGLISGTPTAATADVGLPVTLTFTVAAFNPPIVSTNQIRFFIDPAAAPVVVSPLVTFGTVGTAFQYGIGATNSPTSYQASTLPAGLTINTTTGVISGKPTVAATGSYAITATNAKGSTTKTLKVAISATAPAVGKPYVILHSFQDGLQADEVGTPDGIGNLILAFDGTLAGVTGQGFQDGGTVFTMATSGLITKTYIFGIDQIVNDVGSAFSIAQGADTCFYGTEPGSVFKTNPDGTHTILHTFGRNYFGNPDPNDGVEAQSGVTPCYDGYFYGTTRDGGTANLSLGTLYRVSPQGIYTRIHNFGVDTVRQVVGLAGPDGTNPKGAPIVVAGGSLYGTTYVGGSATQGTIYAVVPGVADNLTILHNFGDGSVPNDGSGPVGNLVQGPDGSVYGITSGGGANGMGTVFKLATDQKTVTILHSFAGGTDGSDPEAGLILGFDGNLYGTTSAGGAGLGTVYRITPTGTLTILHRFSDGSTALDGSNPRGPLTMGADGNLYGLTSNGGTAGNGTVFMIKLGLVPTVKPIVSGTVSATLALNRPGFYRLPLSGPATSWTATGLPTGMTLNAITGVISGNPTKVGLFKTTLTAATPAGAVSQLATLQVTDTPNFNFGPQDLVSEDFQVPAAVGAAFSVSLASYLLPNIAAPYVYQVSGLPAGVTFDPFTGILSGTAPNAGTGLGLIVRGDNVAGTGGVLVNATFAKYTQTITFPAFAPIVGVTAGPVTLAATASSALPVTYKLGTGSPATLVGKVLTLTGKVGTVTVTASQVGTAQYLAAPAITQSFIVSTLKPQTITAFAKIASQPYGVPFTLVLPKASSGNSVGISVVSGPVATISGGTLTFNGVGTVTLQAIQQGDTTYAPATPVTTSFAVVKGTQTITFPTLTGATVGKTLGMTAKSSSGTAGPVITYSVLPVAGETGKATINGTAITFTAAGAITIAADQATNTLYNKAVTTLIHLTVAKGTQTISGFTALGNQPLGVKLTLTATASSGLPITYSLVTTAGYNGTVTIAGRVIRFTGVGHIKLQAQQVGSADYNPVAAVQSLTIQ